MASFNLTTTRLIVLKIIDLNYRVASALTYRIHVTIFTLMPYLFSGGMALASLWRGFTSVTYLHTSHGSKSAL